MTQNWYLLVQVKSFLIQAWNNRTSYHPDSIPFEKDTNLGIFHLRNALYFQG